ncbi:MAG: sugar kinase [Bacillota bacterium]
MDRLQDGKIVLVKRKTRLEELVHRYNTVSQAKFYIEHLGADFSDYVNENNEYAEALSETKKTLESFGRVQVVDRTYLPNFIFGEGDLVVVIGQDGMVANTLKYLSSQLLIGVNPSAQRYDGLLLPFEAKDLNRVIPEVFKSKRQIKEVTMAKAELNDGQSLYAVNDLFIGQKSHVSARYEIKLGAKKEQQSSSGIIVSTGLGSTGWLKSVLEGSSNIVKTLMGKGERIKTEIKMNWDTDYLFFSVREPFPSNTSKTNLVFGKITGKEPLKILSHMPENGVIFSDGIENDFLNFNSGIEATIRVASKKGHLVV